MGSLDTGCKILKFWQNAHEIIILKQSWRLTGQTEFNELMNIFKNVLLAINRNWQIRVEFEKKTYFLTTSQFFWFDFPIFINFWYFQNDILLVLLYIRSYLRNRLKFSNICRCTETEVMFVLVCKMFAKNFDTLYLKNQSTYQSF